MAKSTFTINEKANKPSLVSTDRFLLETSSDTTMSASLDAIYAYCALTMASTSGYLDHTKLSNIGAKTHAQIDAFINNASTLFATAAQGAKADTALQATDSINKSQVGLDKVDNTADVDKPISTLMQLAVDKKADKINTQTYIYVDNTVSDISTSTGVISNPFTSLTSAIQYIGNDARNKFTIILAPSIYTESNIIFPDKSIIVLCNGATIDTNINIINSDFRMYSGTVSKNINTTPGVTISYFENMRFTGLLTANGKNSYTRCEFSSGSITTSSNSSTNFDHCVIDVPIINKGLLSISHSSVTSSNDGAAIDSSQELSIVHILNSTIKNSVGYCVNCDNKATKEGSSFNELINCSMYTTLQPALVLGNAASLISNIVNGSYSGSNLITPELSSIGKSFISVSDVNSMGDLYYRGDDGFLTRLPIGSSGHHLVSNGTVPYWEIQPSNISGNAATSTSAEAASKLSTARKINGVAFDGTSDIIVSAPQLTVARKINEVSFDGTADITITAPSLSTARKINGVAFDGTKDIEITMLDGVSANIMAELDMTNGDVIIDESNGGYAGYILTGSPAHNVSVFIKLQNRYYKFINNITTNYAVAIESGE